MPGAPSGLAVVGQAEPRKVAGANPAFPFPTHKDPCAEGKNSYVPPSEIPLTALSPASLAHLERIYASVLESVKASVTAQELLGGVFPTGKPPGYGESPLRGTYGAWRAKQIAMKAPLMTDNRLDEQKADTECQSDTQKRDTGGE